MEKGREKRKQNVGQRGVDEGNREGKGRGFFEVEKSGYTPRRSLRSRLPDREAKRFLGSRKR